MRIRLNYLTPVLAAGAAAVAIAAAPTAAADPTAAQPAADQPPDPAKVAEAEAKAKAILEQLRKGAKFDDVVK